MNEHNHGSQIIFYQTEDEKTKLEVRLEDETVWLSQKQMAELFQTTTANVNIHLRNIFAEGELNPVSVIKDSLITAADGKTYNTRHYNLRVILIGRGRGLNGPRWTGFIKRLDRQSREQGDIASSDGRRFQEIGRAVSEAFRAGETMIPSGFLFRGK